MTLGHGDSTINIIMAIIIIIIIIIHSLFSCQAFSVVGLMA